MMSGRNGRAYQVSGSRIDRSTRAPEAGAIIVAVPGGGGEAFTRSVRSTGRPGRPTHFRSLVLPRHCSP